MPAAPEAMSSPVLWATGGGVLVLLLLSAFLSATEHAFAAASRTRLHALGERGDLGAERAHQLIADQQRLCAALLLGSILGGVAAVALATWALTALLGGWGVLAAAVVMALALFVIAVLIPQRLAASNPEAAAARARPPPPSPFACSGRATDATRAIALPPRAATGPRPRGLRGGGRRPARGRAGPSPGAPARGARLRRPPGRGGDDAPPRHRDDRRGAPPGRDPLAGDQLAPHPHPDLPRRAREHRRRHPRQGSLAGRPPLRRRPRRPLRRPRGVRRHGRGDGALLRPRVDDRSTTSSASSCGAAPTSPSSSTSTARSRASSPSRTSSRRSSATSPTSTTSRSRPASPASPTARSRSRAACRSAT